jgi:hypothetical protein
MLLFEKRGTSHQLKNPHLKRDDTEKAKEK